MRLRFILIMAIQICWIAVCIALGAVLVKTIFPSLPHPWLNFATGLSALLVYVLLSITTNIVKSLKAPEVQEASELRMTITRYKKYKQMWNEIQTIYSEEGINSKTERKVYDIIKQAPDMNEWRRFGDYQEKEGKEQWKKQSGL